MQGISKEKKDWKIGCEWVKVLALNIEQFNFDPYIQKLFELKVWRFKVANLMAVTPRN